MKIPVYVLRKAIYDVLIERGNAELETAHIIEQEEIDECGVSSELSGEIETTSAGTYILADDVLCGYIPIDEALNYILSEEERKAVISKCLSSDCSVTECVIELDYL